MVSSMVLSGEEMLICYYFILGYQSKPTSACLSLSLRLLIAAYFDYAVECRPIFQYFSNYPSGYGNCFPWLNTLFIHLIASPKDYVSIL